ncbi:hypothetical protein EON65_37460 [archaeon]|nr:MAG: hypothetical protein EON65_37460 [archaeon]
MAEFEVYVSKADFKFNCAHFIIFEGFRERLHGHNYQLSVKVLGSNTLGLDGYVLDFGDIKMATRDLCKSLNEYFICPAKSPNMTITEDGAQLCIVCDDGSQFAFPKSDVALLPILHSSAEEMSHFFWCAIVR